MLDLGQILSKMKQRIFYIQGLKWSSGPSLHLCLLCPNHNSAEPDSPTTCQLLALIGGALRCLDWMLSNAATGCRGKPATSPLCFRATDWHSSAVPKPRGKGTEVFPGVFCKRKCVYKVGRNAWAKGEPAAAELGPRLDLSPVGICSPIDYFALIFVAVRDEWCGETTLPRWECPATTTEGDGSWVTANVVLRRRDWSTWCSHHPSVVDCRTFNNKHQDQSFSELGSHSHCLSPWRLSRHLAVVSR